LIIDRVGKLFFCHFGGQLDNNRGDELMKRRIFLGGAIGSAGLLSAPALLTAVSRASAQGSDIPVGLLFSLTGAVAVVESTLHDAALLAIEEINAAGGGIPKNHWQDAGTRFSRQASVSPTKVGLGLSIVEAVAHAHHGEMTFEHLSLPSGAQLFEARVVIPLIARATL
jgi:signal transduction histidine kinase